MLNGRGNQDNSIRIACLSPANLPLCLFSPTNGEQLLCTENGSGGRVGDRFQSAMFELFSPSIKLGAWMTEKFS